MPTIRPINPAQADAATSQALAAVKAKLGVVPNMMLTLAHSPAALNSYLALSGAVGAGAFAPRRREAIALAVAQANRCGYCLSAHSLLGKGAGLSATDLQQARRGTAADPKDAAVLAMARRIVETQGHPGSEAIAAFRAEGFSDADLLEVVSNVALNIFTNYVNHIAGTEIDFPEVGLDLAA